MLNLGNWKDIKIEGITIEKCVAEFKIFEQKYFPYSPFTIKIYEKVNGHFEGISDLQVEDSIGHFYCSVGYGDTIEKALEDTILYFFEMTSRKKPGEWVVSDFQWIDRFDF